MATIRTVTANGWNVSHTQSHSHPLGYKARVVSVFRVVRDTPWKVRRGEANGLVFMFDSSMDKFLLERGYTQRYFSAYAMAKRVHRTELARLHAYAMAAIRKAESKVEIMELCDSYAGKVAALLNDPLARCHWWNGWHMAARRLRRDLWAGEAF